MIAIGFIISSEGRNLLRDELLLKVRRIKILLCDKENNSMNFRILNRLIRSSKTAFVNMKLLQKCLRLLRFANSEITNTTLVILACNRSGKTTLLNVINLSPECLIYTESSKAACKNYRIKSLDAIKFLITKNSEKTVVFETAYDLQCANVFLDLHSLTKVVWLFRNYHDVVNDAVKRFGRVQKGIMLAIAEGRRDKYLNAMREGMKPDTLRIIKRVSNENMSSEDGAALLWYVRNLIYFDFGLHKDGRILLVNYDDLATEPIQYFRRIFDFISCPFYEKYVKDINALYVRKMPLPVIDSEIELLCNEMMERLNEQYEFVSNNRHL